jgi:FtsP/CotA-like multicopper oxidase with cupredoxin domain
MTSPAAKMALTAFLWLAAALCAPSRAEQAAELRSNNGFLNVTLVAEEGKVQIGDLNVDGATYNGLYKGPVLRVRPGDLLTIRLINHLSQPTNLHFHGMRSSPLGNGDNVHLSVPPGTAFTYQIRIPATQPPGLYWYHAHVHGVSEEQVMHGLTGTLIVEGLEPPGMTERLFVLKDMEFDDDTSDDRIDNDLHSLIQSVNGSLDVQESMRPGETQFWRFTNQSANRAVHIAVEGHRFKVIAEDGEPVVGERYEAVLDMPPAKRLEVLVDAAAPGQYALLAKGVMTGTGANRKPDRVIGHLEVSGETVPAATLPALPTPPPDLRPARIDAERTVVFSQTKSLNPQRQKFYLNGQEFDATRVDVRVPLGNVEEWTIRNDSDDMHAFHIHQIGFQVTEVNGKPAPYTGRVDTVAVPERGEVKIRLPFTDRLILGTFMFHCHVLKHEDKGMMGQIEVYDPAQSALAARLTRAYLHLWWWLHGVPWSLCGLGYA